MLSDFPANCPKSLPEFDGNGALPEGDYQPTKEEFEKRLVFTEVRRDIYRGWNAHRDALLGAGLEADARELLDGSFAQAKAAPGDIDIAVEVPITYDELLAMRPEAPVLALLSGPQMKPRYRCDAYPIYVLPKTDPHYDVVTRRAIEYWTRWFGQTRQGTRKGRVWATVGGFV